MEYYFEEHNGFAFADYPIIDFFIKGDKYKAIESLGRLKKSYIKEIIPNMELARKGELDMYTFGTESITVSIFSEVTKHTKYAGKTYFEKNFEKGMYEIPYEDIYNLMKDFLVEIEKWEKKTGKEKPGW